MISLSVKFCSKHSKILFLIAFVLIGITLGCSTNERQQKAEQATDVNEKILGQPEEIVENKKSAKYSSDIANQTEFQFVEDISYESTDDIVIGQIATFSVDERNRVFIADMDQTSIHVFNPDGSYLRSLGRKGKGPAEFSAVSPTTTIKIHSNRLYVTDFTNSYDFFPTRVQIFSVDDLAFIHTMKLIPKNRNDYNQLEGYYPKQIFPLNEGTFLVAYHRSQFEYEDEISVIRYMVQDSTGSIVFGPIIEQKDLTYLVYDHPSGRTHMHSFPFYGKSLLVVSDDNLLYTARTEEFKIRIHDTRGNQIRTFQHSFKNRVLKLDKLLDRYEERNYMARLDYYEGEDVAIKMIREADNLPDTWPALETMFFDDEDRLWVATIVDDMEIYEWWILKKSGEVITKFKWPRDKPIEVVQNDYMYTRETEEQTGIQEIVRYKIIRDS